MSYDLCVIVFYLVHCVCEYIECKEMYGMKNIKYKREDVMHNFGRFGCSVIIFLTFIEPCIVILFL